MSNWFRIKILTIKYWMQGDDWDKAEATATMIVKNWMRRGY